MQFISQQQITKLIFENDQNSDCSLFCVHGKQSFKTILNGISFINEVATILGNTFFEIHTHYDQENFLSFFLKLEKAEKI